MTKQDLTNHLAYTLAFSHSEARSAVDLIFSHITEALIDGEDVSIQNFASFRIVDKAPRNYRNQVTQVTGEMEMSERCIQPIQISCGYRFIIDNHINNDIK